MLISIVPPKIFDCKIRHEQITYCPCVHIFKGITFRALVFAVYAYLITFCQMFLSKSYLFNTLAGMPAATQ